MKRNCFFLLGIVFALLISPDLEAQLRVVGTMTLNKGVVKLRRSQVDNLYRTAGEKIPVMNLDEIQTGKDSNVTIQLKERDEKLELFSQSFFKLDRITKESSELSMSIGKARFKVKKRLRPLKSRKKLRKRFRVRTANAIVGVKGTEFLMATGTDVTNVLTIEGVVDVASVAVPDVVVELSVNQVTQIKQTATPTAPVSVPPAVKDTILNTDTSNAFNNVSFGAAVPSTGVKPEPKKKSPESSQKGDASPKGNSGSGNATTGAAATSTAAGGLTGAAALLAPDSDDDGAADDDTDSGDDPSASEPQAAESGEDSDFATGTGDDDTFAAESDPNDLGGQDAINLETIETAELEEIEVEEPDIDPDDVLNIDGLIEDIEDNTDDLQEEIEEIQEEILDNQLQEIRIRIKHQ